MTRVFSSLDFLFCFVFQYRVFTCSPIYPGTCFVNQASLELTDLPASSFGMLELKKEFIPTTDYDKFTLKYFIILMKKVFILQWPPYIGICKNF